MQERRPITKRTRALVCGHVGRRDHFGPFFGFVRDELSEFGRRSPNNRAAKRDNPLPYLGIREGCVDFLIDLVDDFGGRALRSSKAIPRDHRVARNNFAYRRNFRKRIRTLGAGEACS